MFSTAGGSSANYIAKWDGGSWSALGTPTDIVDKLHREIVRILALPDVSEKFVQQGLYPVGNTPAEFARYIEAERVKAGRIVKAANIKAN